MTTAAKTPQQLAKEEREKINVESNTPVEKTADELAAEKAAAETAEAEAKAKAEAEAKEKEEADAKAKTEADAAAKKSGEEETGGEEDLNEKDPIKLAKTIERLQKRINQLTSQKKLTEAEKTELANKIKTIEAEKGKSYTDEDLEKISDDKADQKLAVRLFNEACNKLADGAEKIDKKFPEKVKVMTEEYAPIPGQMIGILEDLDNGAAVLNYLANNSDEYGDIHTLTPGKMGVALSKISDKLIKEAEEAKKKPVKEISKVPPAKEPVGGSAKTDETLRDDEPMEDWVRKRNEQVAAAKQRKLAGMR